jgi:colanic acid/amylovoran biosynthesis glycosyltransferase
MLKVAYFANQFPSAVEPYVGAEIEELLRRGLEVVAGSARRPGNDEPVVPSTGSVDLVVLQPLRIVPLLRGLWLCLLNWHRIADLLQRVLLQGRERPIPRMKTLLHTWLGAYYAVRLEGRGIEHIHVHHGYFGSWIAMTAARLLNAGFSMTLHGSDLLLHAAYLDTKLKNCGFCLTVSEFNRRYILEHYPAVEPEKILVARLGVDPPETSSPPDSAAERNGHDSTSPFSILTVGRLHVVKNQAFLLRACAELRARGIPFDCSIAGEGPERRRLESLITRYGLEAQVALLGHVAREQLDSLYARADLVVLTSRSEGIPLVLMEAMARGKVVLAPAVTGIPELVVAGKSGFLYEPGCLGDLVAHLLLIHSLMQTYGKRGHPPYVLSAAKQLDWVRHGARVQIRRNYNREANLKSFGDLFVLRTGPPPGSVHHENPVLQQI